MDEKQIHIQIVKDWNITEIISLYKAGNWWRENSDASIIPTLIKNSYAFAIAVEKQKNTAVGMGRVLSDGVSDAYIQDVVVFQEWRGYGIGRKIVQSLVDYCLSQKVNWIALISEPNQQGFYIPLGFKEMQQYIPMKYEV